MSSSPVTNGKPSQAQLFRQALRELGPRLPDGVRSSPRLRAKYWRSVRTQEKKENCPPDLCARDLLTVDDRCVFQENGAKNRSTPTKSKRCARSESKTEIASHTSTNVNDGCEIMLSNQYRMAGIGSRPVAYKRCI